MYTVEGELDGGDCGEEGYVKIWRGDNVDWNRYVHQYVVIDRQIVHINTLQNCSDRV